MSFMTSGVKILDEPNMYFLLAAGARDKAARPVAVRFTGPLTFVLARAVARGFAFTFAGFVFFADFLAMRALTPPSSRRKPGSIKFSQRERHFPNCTHSVD